jgi:hypothetical protein
MPLRSPIRIELLFLSLAFMGCGPSAEEIAAEEAKAISDARLEEFQNDPASFLMARYRAGEALFTWKKLADADCDLNKVPLWTPYEAHILRQVPYVMRGYAVATEPLRKFFKADGEWYRPRDEVEHLQPTLEEVHCSKKLKSLEERYFAALPEIPQEAKDRFIMDPEAFRTWFQWGSGRVVSPYTETQVRPMPGGGWIWEASGVNCRNLNDGQEEQCSSYAMRCPAIPDGMGPIEIPCEGTILESVRDLALEADPPATEDG